MDGTRRDWTGVDWMGSARGGAWNATEGNGVAID